MMAVGAPFNDDDSPQYVPVSAKPLLPGAVTENHGASRTGGIFTRPEIAAQYRSDPQSAEEPCAHPRAWHLFRARLGTQCETAVQRIGVYRTEDLIKRFPVLEIEVGWPASRPSRRGSRKPTTNRD